MKQKVVLITGASKGIGAAIAKRFSKENYILILNYLKSNNEAAILRQNILTSPKFNGEAVLYSCDVSNYEDTKAMLDWIINEYGQIDIVVNNAGITKGGFLMMNKIDDWWNIVHTNLGSVVNCTKAAIPYFIKQKSGKIINISSASGIRGTAGNSDYSASKAAIIGFTKSMARELVDFGVIVNSIAPGFIDTEMIDKMPEKQKNRIKEMIPMKRMGEVEEVAEIAALLASDKSNYILGQTIVIDGGITM